MSASLNPKKRGLGRGLDALFESDSGVQDNDAPLPAANEIAASVQKKVLSLVQLIPNPEQPRRFFDQNALEELASSLKEYGVLQPLLVRPRAEKNSYEIIAGERRWRAAQIAQLHEVPVIIREFSDTEALQIGLVENLQREDLNPVEEAEGYRRLIEEFGHTQQKVSGLVGKSRSQITNMLRLLGLPESVRDLLRTGDLSMGHARALIGQPDAESLAKEIIAQDLSVRDVESLIAQKKNKPVSKVDSSLSQKDPDISVAEKQLAERLGLQVMVAMGKDGQKGELKISFKSLSQLDYLFDKLNKE